MRDDEDPDHVFDEDDDEDLFGEIYPRAFRIAWQKCAEAIESGNDADLRRILAESPNLAHSGLINDQLLASAAKLGQKDIIAALLEAGIPADLQDEVGGTALMEAAWNGHLEVARMLLQAGADPNATIEEDGSYGDPRASGRCALFCALSQGHEALIELLEPLTDSELRPRAYESAEQLRTSREEDERDCFSEATVQLFTSAHDGNIEKLQSALASGADFNAVLEPEASNRLYGSTPLSFAAAKGRMEAVAALLAAGADPDFKNHRDLTAADYADLNSHSDVAQLLRNSHGESR